MVKMKLRKVPRNELWAVVLSINGKASYVDGPYLTQKDARAVKKVELEDVKAYPEIDHTGWEFKIVRVYNLITVEMLKRELGNETL